MEKKFPEAEVFQTKKVELKSPIIFAGFVGAGLVGPLAITHMITELKMVEIAVMRSKYLPPSTVFMRGRLRHPFRFYQMGEGTGYCGWAGPRVWCRFACGLGADDY